MNQKPAPGLDHRIEPKIVRIFPEEIFNDLKNHIKEVRRCFDWPGVAYHDANQSDESKFNRWYWHNLPLLKMLHNSFEMRKLANEIFGQPVKPSYVFLSMYGPEGTCPVHVDRPQCQFTMDLLINTDGEWPIYVDEKPYILKPGEALCYSGTGQIHYRKPMKEDSNAKFADLAFFHFVPETWMGELQ